IGAMHRMPIRLLGRGRSGTEHELTPSFARKSALGAVTPPFPSREARLGTVEAHPTQQTSELLLRSLCFRALMCLRALPLDEPLEQRLFIAIAHRAVRHRSGLNGARTCRNRLCPGLDRALIEPCVCGRRAAETRQACTEV